MCWWSDRVVPHLADRSLRGRDVGVWREQACAPLRGRVVEIGFGGGLNVRWYPEAVHEVIAVEPSDVGWELSARRRTRTGVPIHRGGLDGQRLPAADASVDAVLSTFTLCTIPDVAAALAEVARVLVPGGVLCLLEHGVSPEPDVARWQGRLDGVQQRLGGGCSLTRDPVALTRDAGLAVTVTRTGYLTGPSVGRPWTWLTAATAVKG